MTEHCNHISEVHDQRSIQADVKACRRTVTNLAQCHDISHHGPFGCAYFERRSNPSKLALAQLVQGSKLSADNLKSWKFPNSLTAPGSHSTLVEGRTNSNTRKISTTIFSRASELSEISNWTAFNPSKGPKNLDIPGTQSIGLGWPYGGLKGLAKIGVSTENPPQLNYIPLVSSPYWSRIC